MCNFNYITFGNEISPSRLVVFLHGYNSSIDDVAPYAKILANIINDALIIVPEAQFISERNPLKKQWYALVDVDPERKRRNPDTSTDEIIEIYNKTGKRISLVAKDINDFISILQKKYKINNKNTFLMGFSQGAMLAIYAGLTRRYKLGGIFPFSGIVCGKDELEKEMLSTPSVYLFHGTDDSFVQYKTLDFTKEWLETHAVDWEAIEYEGIDHKLIEEEMIDAAEIIGRSA